MYRERLVTRIRQNRWQAKLAKELAHEIKNPLAAISTSLQFLSFKLKLEEDNKVIIDSANAYAEYLNQLLSDYLMVTSLNEEVESTKFNIADVVNSCCNLVKTKAELREVTFNVSYQEKDMFVQSNFGKLQQIIFNLLFNSAKYAKEDSVVEISCSYSTTPGFVDLDIKDVSQQNAEVNEFSSKLGLEITDRLAKCLGITLSKNSDYLDGFEYQIKIPVAGMEVMELKNEAQSLSLDA